MRLPAIPPAVIAHRGASAYAPENTLAAFALALLQRADAIELDLRATSDGELVVLHDETLARTTGDPRAITEVSAAELLELDPAVRPPTLAAVLDCFGTGIDYLIEIKRIPPRCEEALIDAIAERDLFDHVVVQSFDHLTLFRLSLHDSRLDVAVLFRPEADPLLSLEQVSPFAHGIGPCWEATTPQVVEAARLRGFAVRPWTVNSEIEMQRLIDLGVDALITDVPDRARTVLARGHERMTAASAA